jgi:Mycothiol maleylpyruvate isomerase N-terminal domain
MTTHEELLQKEDAAWSAFVDAFAAVPEDRRDKGDVVPGWNVKDIVWHCGYWAGSVVSALEKIGRGEASVEDPDVDASNALVTDEGRSLTWDQIVVQSEQNRGRAREALLALETLTPEAIEEFAGETFDHYDEHAVELRAFMSA